MNDKQCFKCHKERSHKDLDTWWKFSGSSFNKVLVNMVNDIVLCGKCTQETLDAMGVKFPRAII